MIGIKEIGGVTMALGALLYVLFMYGFGGPEIGMRQGMAHETKHCRANYVHWLKDETRTRLSKLKAPVGGVEMRMIDNVRNSEVFKAAQAMTRFGLRPGQQNPMEKLFGPMINPGNVMSSAAQAARAKFQASKRAFETGRNNIREWAKLKASKAGDVCKESIIQTVSDTQTDWAIYAGSFGLIQPPGVKNFRANIKRNLVRARDEA